jgi:hypothetical protein
MKTAARNAGEDAVMFFGPFSNRMLPEMARIIFALLFTLSACDTRQATIQVSPDAWRADLRELARELPARHANAFHTVSREQFAAEVAQLDAAIPRLTADQVLVEMMRIVALIGDGHTHLDVPPDWPRYPVELAWFGDELRVVAVTDSSRVAAGGKVLGIGNVPLDSVLRMTSMLVPRGENGARTRAVATMMLTSPAVLRGLRLTDSEESAPFDLEAATGERITVTLRAASDEDMSDMQLVTDNPPLWLRRIGEPWWTEILRDERTVYMSFSRYPLEAEFRNRCHELAKALSESGAERLIIDLRRNGGGDLDRFRRLLLPVIRKHPVLGRTGGVYAITGPATFSAAMVNALDLRRHANAVLVGEPTGARPNSYSEHGEFLLTNSGLRVSYATRYYRFAAEGDTAVIPDVRIEPTWQQFRSGRDPVLDWILAQPIR